MSFDLKSWVSPASEADVKNPLPATLWFLRHDAGEGLLEANGFVRSKHPTNDQILYTQDRFHLFRNGFWFEKDDHFLVYRNPSRSFYRLGKDQDPLGIPGLGEQRVKLEEGYQQIEPILSAHEEFVATERGSSYRYTLIQRMPRAEQRYAKNWKVLFGCERGSAVR